MATTHLTLQVVLRKKEERRILAGHPWAYSNEIQEVRGTPGAGDVVELLSAGGLSLGVGFYHPHSLIAYRHLSSEIQEIDRAFFDRRLAEALSLRATLFGDANAYRLVHGESDYLPGLVVDRFGDVLSVQSFSAGMDRRLPEICDALQELLSPAAIVERNESALRTLEELPMRKGMLRGTRHDAEFTENGIRYAVDALEGQKTGYYLDQRMNRARVRTFSQGRTVLDCFCNDGGFSLNAAAGDAAETLGIDSSSDAVARASKNADRNGLKNCRFEQADVFTRLPILAGEGRTFDIVILDPPSFTRSRKSVPAAKKGYRELHRDALNVLKPGGLLVTSSCSHHILPETFLTIVDEVCHEAMRPVQMLEWAGASPDHPVLPGVAETRYLKFGVFRVR
jgi:23S rRNA (cytosine1962-C5)-methyltransferase